MKKITFLAIFLATFLINAQVLSEDFSAGSEGSTFPNGWTTTTEAGTVGNWIVGSTANTGVPAYGGDTGMINGGCDGLYALLDSDGFGSAGSQNASLVSPVMDLSGYSELIVKFNHHFRVYSANADIGYVEATIDGGATWGNIATFTGPNNYIDEGLTSLDMSAYAGNSAVQIRFRYVGAWGYYWGIDNIEVTQCTSAAPATVSIPTLPLDGATGVVINIDGEDSIINFEWPAAEEGFEVENYTFNLGTSTQGFPNVGSLAVGNNAVNLIYNWAANTTYYWSVDASNCGGVTIGTIFSFTTGESGASPTVFERLQGNVYRQIETPQDCGTCEEEINYYMFSSDGLRIIGTEYDGTCEQDDFTPFGDCAECGEIVTNTTEEFEVCANGIFCQTITFTSEAEDEIQFDFPFFNQTWTAQLYDDEVPCLGTAGLNDNEINNLKMFPNPANDYLNFATNSSENIDIQIFNVLGKSVLKLENVENIINISELKSGLYFVKINLGVKSSIKRLIIN
tara:strand:+ start:4694 stop:6223 length:1530 start_codon:yes stop_codon:yes gene_type:complete